MGDAVLIAAQSGRALAQAARRAGLVPYVADLFCDADTLLLAEAHRPLAGPFGTGRLGGDRVLARLDELAALAGPRAIGVILGSGFEGAPGLVARIAVRHRLIGAGPETVAALKDPFAFAALCAELGIPHPCITADPVADPETWLLKRAGGSGGGHIRAATRSRAPAGAYLQVRVPGRAFALNLLADGAGLHVLALTEQWTAPTPRRPFRYGGALARGRDEAPGLPPALVSGVTEAVAGLVRRTGLRGLASADFLCDGAAWWLTEINPRPGATLDVLDRRDGPLLAAHIAASLGRLPAVGADPQDAAAAGICYAARTHGPVPAFEWPDHVRDRPRAGTIVVRDAPLCTVVATGPDAAAVKRDLARRTAHLRARLSEEEARDHEHQHQASEPQRALGPPDRAAGG